VRSYYVVQAGFELVDLSNPPASAYQGAGTIGRHHHAWLFVTSFDYMSKFLFHFIFIVHLVLRKLLFDNRERKFSSPSIHYFNPTKCYAVVEQTRVSTWFMLPRI
jgi:hypothetical protein